MRSSLEEVANRAAAGSSDPRIRAWSIECLERKRRGGSKVNNERARAEVLLAAVQQKLWVPDPVGVEFIAGAHLTACVDKDAPCFHGGDCFPEGTLVFKKGHELDTIESLKPGDQIWGLDAWSTVEAVAYKGVLPIDVIRLNNGSDVKLTASHKVAVLDCCEHPMLDEEAQALPPDRNWRGGGNSSRCGCSCETASRQEKITCVEELRRGMVLRAPKRLPFGTENLDPDLAYVDGLFVADGWADWVHNRYFSIAGKDGFPKEEQKRSVEKICQTFGIKTSWAEKDIRVVDRDWTLRMQLMGHLAPNKHFISINLDEVAAAESLRGVMADSGQNTVGVERTFTTTSKILVTQVRVLHKMFGITCGYRYIENHGGLGPNPIHRLGTRGNKLTKVGRHPWLLRIRSVERDVIPLPCWDIQTSDHRVYLPEHDVTTQQCDDLCVLQAASFLSVGLYTMIVGHAYNTQKNIQHVLTAVRVKNEWLYADPSTDFPLGKCEPFSRERLLSVPNVKVICDENACLTSPEKFDPDQHGFVTTGTFVGVDGLPVRSRIRWLP